MIEDRIKIDKTKSVTLQLGVSKIFTVSIETMWEFLLSDNGIAVWLGEINSDEFEIGKAFKTQEGIEGKLTIFKPDSHLRMAWKLKNWAKFSIIEIRITNSKGKARVLFHHTKLYEMEQRIEMKKYWEAILIRIKNKLE